MYDLLENACQGIDWIANAVIKTIKFAFWLLVLAAFCALFGYYLSIIPAIVWVIWALCSIERPCSCLDRADQRQQLP